MTFLKKYIGDKAFYKKILKIAIPIMIQSGITNFVSLLDNVMVGKLGTEAMSSVSIINQFVFIFNLLIFGAVSAAGIFTAQFYGEGNTNGVRNTFRFKVISCVLSVIFLSAVMLAFRNPLIELFLTQGESGDIELTKQFANDYLSVAVFTFLPFAFSSVYTSTMRETGETAVPLYASIAAVATNFVFNLILIFGVGDVIPALGVTGAAIATLLSRLIEVSVLIFWGHSHKNRCPYLEGAYSSFRIPRQLVRSIVICGLPIMANEFFWSLAITLRNQAYSTRGLEVVAAQNISTTVYNVFSVVYLTMGSVISILIGHRLGAGEIDKAIEDDRKMIFFSLSCATVTAIVIASLSPFIPLIYNIDDTVRRIATEMMLVNALFMPFESFANSSYFTLRSGGKVMITILSDSGFMWVLVVPLTFVLSRFTSIPILPLFFIGQACDAAKGLFGMVLLKKVKWANKLIDGKN